MCGIVGVWSASSSGLPDDSTFAAMRDALRHRGPDDEGAFTGPGVRLGHRRLSIVDVAGGHQPLSNEDGTIWIVFNGEIYNFPALKQRLEAAGHRFATRSDTESIVHLYEQEGDAAIGELGGMF